MFHQACLQLFPRLFLRNLTASYFYNPPRVVCELFCVPLKERLKKNLKDIRDFNNAHEFCGMLLNAKKVIENSQRVTGIEPSLRLPKPNYYYSNMFIDKNPTSFIHHLYNFIPKEEPKFSFVDLLFLVLFSAIEHEGKASELKSLLLDVISFGIMNSKWQDATEYLKYTINYVENLVRLCGEKGTYFFKTCPPKDLEDLRFLLYKSAIYKAEPLLDIIFEIGRVQLQFSEEEKLEFGTLMVEAIIPITSFIYSTPLKPRLYGALLQRRSSLQFFKDFYAKFPARNGTLLENFYMDMVNNTIDDLDELITCDCDSAEERIALLKNESDVEYEFSDIDEVSDLEEAGASEMPESHTWWAKCSQIFNKK